MIGERGATVNLTTRPPVDESAQNRHEAPLRDR
jgi:hypothetical protein